MCTTCSTDYENNIKSAIAANPTFKAICDFNIQHFPVNGYSLYYRELQNGKAILQTPQQLNAYMASYSDMHRHKLNQSFIVLFKDSTLQGKSIEVIDWGCGQAFASCVLIDFIKEQNINLDIYKFTLIEPSRPALIRGNEHINAIYQRQPKCEIALLNDNADSLLGKELKTNSNSIKIHLFSNLLDICTLDLQKVANTIKKSQKGLNYFVCVSPINGSRLNTFFQLFSDTTLISAKSNCILDNVFSIKLLRMIPWNIYRQEIIFKTNLFNP